MDILEKLFQIRMVDQKASRLLQMKNRKKKKKKMQVRTTKIGYY